MRGIRVYRRSGLLLASLALSPAGGCAAKSEDANARLAPKTAEVTSEEAHHGRSFRVGILLPSGGEQANATLKRAMQDAARTNNLILTFETSQAQQSSAPIERLQSQKGDALLVCARNDEDALTVTRPAREWGMPLVALVSEPPPEEKLEEAGQAGKAQAKPLPGVMTEIAPRSPHIGTTTGARVNDALHARGGIVLITGRSDTLAGVSNAAWNDLRVYLHRHPALQVLETQAGPLPPADAQKMLDRHGGKINALVCDDETALPFLAEICREKKRADIALFAFDAGRATLTMVQKPVQNFVEKPTDKLNPKPVAQSFQSAVVQKIGFAVPADAPGKLAVQTVAACLRGEKPRSRVWVTPVPVPIAAPSLFAPPSVKPTPLSTPGSTSNPISPGEKTP